MIEVGAPPEGIEQIEQFLRQAWSEAATWVTDAANHVAEARAAMPSWFVDLGPWLDGTWRPPAPTHGAIRDDGSTTLYPGRWHTLIGPTGAGKTWAELAHVRDELLSHERHVVFAHFEETLPGGTVARLLAMGVPAELLRERFHWLGVSGGWPRDGMARALAELPARPGLVVLDGINAACTNNGQDPLSAAAVGWYRDRWVTPAVSLGAAVISAGHPPKARDRQDERHGYGSTAWLDEVDGVAYRLTPHPHHPVRRGGSGTAALHVVKDRYGEVERLAVPDNREGWSYVGSLVVDDAGDGTRVRISAPSALDGPAAPPDKLDQLAEAAERVIRERHGFYESENAVRDWLKAAGVKHSSDDLPAALERLAMAGRLDRDEYVPRRARGGRLTAETVRGADHDETVN